MAKAHAPIAEHLKPMWQEKQAVIDPVLPPRDEVLATLSLGCHRWDLGLRVLFK